MHGTCTHMQIFLTFRLPRGRAVPEEAGELNIWLQGISHQLSLMPRDLMYLPPCCCILSAGPLGTETEEPGGRDPGGQ